MASIIGKIERVIRHGVTCYGNPMHSIVVNGETYRISNDAAMNYGIDNMEFREKDHEFLLTRAGRIYDYWRNNESSNCQEENGHS